MRNGGRNFSRFINTTYGGCPTLTLYLAVPTNDQRPPLTATSCQAVFPPKAIEPFLGSGEVRSMMTCQLLGFTSVRTLPRIQYISDRSFPAFRVEWSKARARSERWREEVMILREEMRRTLQSFQFFSDVWTTRGSPHSLLGLSRDPIIREGLTAYADYQSHVFASLRCRFHSIWSGLEKGDDPIVEPVSAVSEEALLELEGGDI